MAEKLLRGIDVSHHQLPGRFVREELEKLDFMISRCCYGRRKDNLHVQHLANARRAGLKVGAYVFYRQSQTPEVQFEAFKQHHLLMTGDIIPVVDLEDNEKYDGKMSPHLHNTGGRELCRLLKEHYGDCMIYISPGHYLLLGKPKWMDEYKIWTAHWNVSKPAWPDEGKWAVWQDKVDFHPSYPQQKIDLNVAHELPLIPRNEEPKDPDEPKEKVCEVCEETKKKVLELVSESHKSLECARRDLDNSEARLAEMVKLLVDDG